jgi:hypothetical protein
MEAGVDDFESFILKGFCDKLGPAIMPVQTGFRD